MAPASPKHGKAGRMDPRHHQRWTWAKTLVCRGAAAALPSCRCCGGVMGPIAPEHPPAKLPIPVFAGSQFLFLFFESVEKSLGICSQAFWAAGLCAVSSCPLIKKEKKGAAIYLGSIYGGQGHRLFCHNWVSMP